MNVPGRYGSVKDRFDAKVTRGDDPDACWGWLGAVDGHGYGQMNIDKRRVPATHISLEMDGKPRPSKALCALHTCDNPPCANPRHLYWGTRTRNTADARRRGRLDTLGLRLGRGDKGARERAVQRDILAVLSASGLIVVHIPNGSHLAGGKLARAKQMAALRRDGLRPGVPDLLILGRNGAVGFMEVKREVGGVLSPNQVMWRDLLAERGHQWALVRSAEDALDVVKRWGWR